MQYYLLALSKINVFQTWTPSTVVVVNDDATVYGCLRPNNAFRRTCRRLVTNEWTVLCWKVLVCLSTGMVLAIQPRYDMGSATYTTLFALQVVCTAFFWVRMLTEMAASGLVEGKHSFLRSLWNWIELVVNVFAILQLIPPTSGIRWMRAVAAARPLRFFVFFPCWKQLLVPLARGFPYICDIFFVFVLCAFAFAIIGVLSIGGELYQRCYITEVHNASNELYAGLTLPFLLLNVTNACGVGFTCPVVSADVTVECVSSAVDYPNPFFTYQNVGAALLRVLKVATLDVWHEDLEELMNVKGSAAALFLVALVAVSQFLLVVAMTVVYNAYAHLDSWFVRSAAASHIVEDRQRKDGAVQTAPPRQVVRPPPLTRAARPRTGDDGGYGDDNDMSADGGQLPALTAYATSHTHATADQRYARDFLRRVHVRGFWAGLRGLEQTTTTCNSSGMPRVRWAAVIVDSLPSVVLMMVLSIGNLVLLAVVSVYTTAPHARDIRVASSAMSLCFLLPVVLRVVAFGLVATLKDVWNYVDVTGAVTGILEIAAPHIFDYRAAGILRVLRYVHAGKYVFSFQQYHYQLWCLLSLVLLWAATMLLFAVVGMQLFPFAYTAGDGAAVQNGDFTTLWTALLACFRAFTGDVWTRYLTVVGDEVSVATSAIFFTALQLSATLLLFALETSILFRGFRDAARDEDMLNITTAPPLLLLPPITEGGGTSNSGGGGGDAAFAAASLRRRRQARSILGIDTVKQLCVRRDALFLISPSHPLRRWLRRFFGSFFYFVVSTCCVLLGLVALFFEARHMTATRRSVLHAINIAYFVVFMVEMVMKWIAYGVFSPGVPRGEGEGEGGTALLHIPAYFREPLNWVDLIANGTSLAGIAYPPLRVGRVIRSVRLCTTQEHPNRVFLELVASLRYVAKTLPLIFFLYVAFAVAGMQIFAGGLHRCSDPSVTQHGDCHGSFSVNVTTYTGTAVVVQERVWERAAFHYDAFGPALLSVFALTNVNNYGPFMDDAMAIVGGGSAMSYNHAGYFVIFFFAALLMIRFYALRCVAAVLAAKLRRLTMDTMGTALLTVQQTRFAVSRQTIRYMLFLDSRLPPLPCRVSWLCHRVLTACPLHAADPCFALAMNVVLFIVCAFLAASHTYAAPWVERMLLGVECVGVAVCGAEVLLGFVAYGGAFVLTAPRLVDVVLFGLMVVGVASPPLSFFRVALVVKLIKSTHIGMQLLPVVRHARLLCSAIAIYALVLLTYAVVGALVFGDVAPRGAFLTEKRNFSTVIGSLLVLFDCSTLDQWHRVMYACFDGAPCRSDASAVCGHTYAAVSFFVSFVVVANLIAAQLVFAAMVNAFTVPFYVDVIEPFLQVRRTWLQHAGAEQLKCDFGVFLRLLPRLPPSLTDGLAGEKTNESSTIAFLSSLRLPLDAQLCVGYQDLLRGLAYRKYKVHLLGAGTATYRRAALLSLTAGEHYGQLMRQRYCDQVTQLAQAKVEAVHLDDTNSAAPSVADGVSEAEAFHPQHDDYAVPHDAVAIPTSNIFLYSFPGESNERVAPPPPQR